MLYPYASLRASRGLPSERDIGIVPATEEAGLRHCPKSPDAWDVVPETGTYARVEVSLSRVSSAPDAVVGPAGSGYLGRGCTG